MKLENTIGIISILVFIAMVLFFVHTFNNHQQTITTNTNTNQELLDASTIAKHNTSQDCWIIVSNNVYAVTGYLNRHPGGASIIVPYCGGDATAAYDTKGGMGSHSSVADQELLALLIGTVSSAVNTSTNIQSSANTNTTASISNNSNTTSSQSVTLDTATIARHATASDCWLIINNKVYAVSGYLNSHPGGVSIVVPYCGGDATTAFNTKGGRGTHSSLAVQELQSLYIGTVGTTATTTTIQQAANTGSNLSINQGDDNERESDD